MTIIHSDLDILAAPESVYDLIADIKGFARFFPHIQKVTELEPGIWRWDARIGGVPVYWEGEIIRADRPFAFAWSAKRGLANEGYYHLTPTERGTHVHFFMTYELPGGPLRHLLGPLLDPMTRRAMDEAMERIKDHLEVEAKAADMF